MPVVYQAKNLIDGKVYIGKTTNFIKRKYNHLWHAKKGSNTYFHRAIVLYGESNFEWSILHEGDDTTAMEIQLIEEHKSFDREYGYNLTKGGEGTIGWTPSEETRRRISEAHRGKPTGRRPSDINIQKFVAASHLRKGIPLTAAHRANLVLSNIGRTQSKETIAKRVASKMGYKHSEETKRKISEARKNKPRTDAQIKGTIETGNKLRGKQRPDWVKQKLSVSHTGKQFSETHLQHIKENNNNRDKSWMQSDEYKEKMSASLKGKKRSPESIERYRQAAILREQKKKENNMTKYGIITETTGTWVRLLSESNGPGKPLVYETKEEAELAALSLNISKYKIASYRG